MRTGKNWVATNWGPSNQSQKFSWTAKINKEKRTAEVSWHMDTVSNDSHRRPTFYYSYGDQDLWIDANDNGKWELHPVNISSEFIHGLKICFADKDSPIDKTYGNTWGKKSYKVYPMHDDLKIDNVNGYLLGSKWAKGSFTVKYDETGSATFTVKGSFHSSYDNGRKKFNHTFSLPKISGKKCTIKYNLNTDTYGVSGLTSKSIPYIGYSGEPHTVKAKAVSKSHDFIGWSRSPSDAPFIQPGATYVLEQNETWYAVWKPKKFKLYVSKNKGQSLQVSERAQPYEGNGYSSFSTYQPSISTSLYDMYQLKFGSKIKLSNTKPTKTGYTFSDWTLSSLGESSSNEANINPGVFYSGSPSSWNGKRNIKFPLTLSAVPTGHGWFLGAIFNKNKYKITLKDSITDKTIRTFTASYGDKIKGDFTYSCDKAYNLQGWSLTKNKPYDTESKIPKDLIYIRNNDYSKYPANSRIYTYTKNITLYTVFTYNTTVYVYNGKSWRLAVPYIYDGSKWRQAISYIYDGKKWRL